MIDEQKSWKIRLRDLDVSQRDFADIIEENETVLSLYLNGKREPRLEKFIKICKAIRDIEAAQK